MMMDSEMLVVDEVVDSILGVVSKETAFHLRYILYRPACPLLRTT